MTKRPLWLISNLIAILITIELSAQSELTQIAKSNFEMQLPQVTIRESKVGLRFINFNIGPEWSRINSSSNGISKNPTLEKLLNATAKVVIRLDLSHKYSGSAVYLGYYNNEHILITNYHVLSNNKNCRQVETLSFEHFDLYSDCKRVLVSFPEIDVTIFSLKEMPDKAPEPLNFDFTNEYPMGTKLFTAGYGFYKNSSRQLTYDASKECQLMRSNKNPLLINSKKSELGIVSIIHACEISEGDSGSVIVDAETGNIIGLNYLVTTKRSHRVQEEGILEEWKMSQPQEMKESLSYAVSLSPIYKNLIAFTEKTPKDSDEERSQVTIRALLDIK